ncbi:MAG TPA: DUF2630 family protein [Solirubrobacteraceae bacterium]|jgi:predicted phage gp36 major capsid-like protein
MDDAQIQSRIEKLEAEERRLRSDEERSAHHGDSERIEADRDRLAAIKVELDQQWDLLRQRRALRNAGSDPDQARVRDGGTVENYLG